MVVGGGSSGRAGGRRGARRPVATWSSSTPRDGDEVVAIYAGPTDRRARTPTGMLARPRRRGRRRDRRGRDPAGRARQRPGRSRHRARRGATARRGRRPRPCGRDRHAADGVPCERVFGTLVRFDGDDGGHVARGRRRDPRAASTSRRRATPRSSGSVGRATPRGCRLGADGRRRGPPSAWSARRPTTIPLPPAPTDRGVVCRCTGRRSPTSTRAWDTGFRSSSCSSARRWPGSGPARAGPACRTSGPGSPRRIGRGARAVHRPTRDPPDHHRRGRRRRLHRRLPAHARSTTSTSPSAPGWTGSAAGGGRGTTATRVAEYWAVREGVSIGDVSTLGKLVVSGPDVVEASSGSIRATSPTSSPAGRATRCCSTSAATSWTTG